jgi:acyl-CoA synthetase (AMP-forming)/AMP-acid ligase II
MRTLAGLTDAWRARGDEPLLRFTDAAISGSDMAGRAEIATRALLECGVDTGDRVAFLGANHPVYFDLLAACARIGSILVAVNWRLGASELADVLRDAEPRVVVAEERYIDAARPLSPLILPFAGSVPDSPFAAAGRVQEPARAAPEDPLLLLYTSGTTGKQKGVVFTHQQVLSNVENMVSAYHYAPGAVALVTLPVFHLGGGVHGLTALVGGGRIQLTAGFDVDDVASRLRSGVTHVPLVPSQLQVLLDAFRDGESTLTHVIYGGAPMSVDLLRRCLSVFRCSFVGSYGATEIGTLTALTPEDHRRALEGEDGLLRSAGRPLPGHEIRLVDPEGSTGVPVGSPGEVWVRGPVVMQGYWPVAGSGLDPGGWFRTGDIARRDEAGYLYLVDRLKDIVITGGENVSSLEVEEVLRTHPEVADAAVVGVPDSRWGEAVWGFVVLRPGARARPPHLIAFSRERIAHYKCPRRIVVVEQLPRNEMGKVRKAQLRRMAQPA